jgi:hypothetical protein
MSEQDRYEKARALYEEQTPEEVFRVKAPTLLPGQHIQDKRDRMRKGTIISRTACGYRIAWHNELRATVIMSHWVEMQS